MIFFTWVIFGISFDFSSVTKQDRMAADWNQTFSHLHLHYGFSGSYLFSSMFNLILIFGNLGKQFQNMFTWPGVRSEKTPLNIISVRRSSSALLSSQAMRPLTSMTSLWKNAKSSLKYLNIPMKENKSVFLDFYLKKVK